MVASPLSSSRSPFPAGERGRRGAVPAGLRPPTACGGGTPRGLAAAASAMRHPIVAVLSRVKTSGCTALDLAPLHGMCRKAERANFPLDNTEQMSYIVCEGLCRVYLMHSTGKLFGQLLVLFRCPRPVMIPAVYPGGIIAGIIFFACLSPISRKSYPAKL